MQLLKSALEKTSVHIRCRNIRWCLVMFVFGGLGSTPAQTKVSDFTVLPNSTVVLNDSAYLFNNVTINDGGKIVFTAEKVNIKINDLTLNGLSTLDFSPLSPIAQKPPRARSYPQAHNNPAPQNGHDGDNGLPGSPGANGNGLNLTVGVINSSSTGWLWVRSDGGPGGPGGDGGDGGKGSSGPQTCFSNPNGGNGGRGGRGGSGGRGGNTGRMTVIQGTTTITPTQSSGVAPSARPVFPPGSKGFIVISGAVGRGGEGGAGGRGGDGGEGHQNHFPCTASDSWTGKKGSAGQKGPDGPNGTFITPN